MPATDSDDSPLSERAAKRLRREQARRLEQEQRRPLVRAGVLCGSVAIAGLAAALVLALTGLGDAAIWVAGPTGVPILCMVGVLVAIERTKKRKKERIGAFGWLGLVFATVAGLQLLTALALFLAGLDKASETVALVTLVPALLAVGLLGAGSTKATPRNDGTNNASTTLNDIVRNHWG